MCRDPAVDAARSVGVSIRGIALGALLIFGASAPACAAFAQGVAYGAPPPPPPPPGYGSHDLAYDAHPERIQANEAYEHAIESWAAENCVLERDNKTAAGAVIGGVLGALSGAALGKGAGAVVGGAVGATAGAAVGASSTSPGCPPGYVVRQGAPAFVFVNPAPQWVYVAPPDYRPWILINGRWVYRPYPYHRFWRAHYWRR
jgi:hypothetical protein